MKPLQMIFIFLSLFFGSAELFSFSLAKKLPSTSSFGSGIPTSQFVSIDEVLKNPKKYVGKAIAVRGKVTDVCPMKGCWMTLRGTANSSIKIKVEDDKIVIPKSAKGKTASAYGTLEALKLSQKKAIRHFRHLAEEKGENFDPSSIKGPLTIYQIQGRGGEIYENSKL